MNTIQVVDLQGQYQRIMHEIQEKTNAVFQSAAFIKGTEVTEFEKKLSTFNSVNHTISCGNGTDALQIALMALDLEPGDEVIIPAFTYVATAEVAALLRLKPVLVDADPETFNIDATKVKNAISNRSKSILPVHLFGQCADMETLSDLAQKHNLQIIEDNAQAIGADYTFSNGQKIKAGTIGHIGTTSFFPSKNLGCYGDGGALFTNDSTLARKISMIANHGQSEKYYHDVIGVNSRLDTIQAAILNIKLQYLHDYTTARQQAAAYYDEALADIPEVKIPARDPKSTHVFHQYTLKIENSKRDALQHYLKEHDIPTMIYYPLPVHLQKAYQYLGYKKGDFPVAETLSKKVLSLPMHTELSDDQLNYITDKIRSFFK
ncbi:DegT/DnrJ/EryC1/StrS family aminotransferase [Adhaeribacter terreus]|uniref:DegT/DnrJ/EryC1/StrS family aminotransferase n=1 Tax=Adhaeribacter terreus TaxID=529703 RepID=A0ABW0E7Z8_9BACT